MIKGFLLLYQSIYVINKLYKSIKTQNCPQPFHVKHTAALQTSRKTGAPCRPKQSTASATWSSSISHLGVKEEIKKEEKQKNAEIVDHLL